MNNINELDLQELKKIATQGYGFYWSGKGHAVKDAENDETEFIPYTENNMYIEGDNIIALKRLQRDYEGKIKMIYIDPPYNTGKDSFIYGDNFRKTERQLEKYSSSIHSEWLNMMYPRLKLAKSLLTDDGIICISIDDNEVGNLKNICDDIFGEYNKIPPQYIQVRYANKNLTESKVFKPLIENVLIYAKNIKSVDFIRPKEEYLDSKFCFEIIETGVGGQIQVGNDLVTVFKKGEWDICKKQSSSIDLLKETWVTGSIYTNMSYGDVFKRVVEPRVGIDGLGSLYKVHGRGDDGLGYRYYTNPQKQNATKGKMYSGMPLKRKQEMIEGNKTFKFLPIITFKDMSAEFGNIRHEGDVGFNNGKKPISFLNNLLSLIDTKDSIILDFFSGSSSTAHAVMQLNAEDGGNRKFIMIQIPEICSGEFENICELGKERIRRAGEKIKADETLPLENREKLNTDFEVIKL